MEFREFFHLFVGRWKLFCGVVSGAVLLSLVILLYQPPRFEADLTVNVTRAGTQRTADYTYDQFYRLQADERFADTVVRWLATPSLREDIRSEARVSSEVADSIGATRLSSQMISVTYVSRSKDGFGDMAAAIPDILNRETGKLDMLSNDPDWFVVMADAPSVRDARLPARLLLPLGVAIGLFAAFWSVLIDWYFRGPSRDRQGNDG